MGWFWGSNNDDPVKKLDPGLREYLENEAPKKYVPASQSPPAAEEKASPSQATSSDDASSASPAVPSASLFPDGRYAHLWKTYKPPSPGDVGPEATGVPSLKAHSKQRQAMVKRAAMENCSIENEIYHLCLKSPPTMTERLTACQDKNKVFTRCFTTQSKFLQALGYASAPQWDDEREERIQLHADKLYHEMLDYEKQVEEAREAGRDPPPLTSLFNPQAKPIERASVGPTELEIPGEPIPEGFTPSKPLERLTPHERELEIRAYYQQLEEQKAYVKGMLPIIRSHDEARDKRREKLVSWFGETVGNWMTR
ncbi:hypothetical protein BDW67DRAFT_163110 [Aspergillus spinulosporus]